MQEKYLDDFDEENKLTNQTMQYRKINKCIATSKIKKLNSKSLADIMAKYNKDICANDIDRAMLCTDDVEPFIKYKYPILRLRYLSEESDLPKRLYIKTTIILYHCCMSSQTGAVDEDICRDMTKYEQELILKFCENLCDMEVTINNVESAIKDAFEKVGISDDPEASQLESSTSSDTVAQASSESTTKCSIATLPSDENIPEAMKLPTLTFNSSITVLPSVMADTSTYSELMSESDDVLMAEKHIYVDSDEINVYALGGSKEAKTEAHITPNMKDVQVKETYAVREDYAVSKHKVFEKGYSRRRREIDTLNREEGNIQAASSEMKKTRCLSGCSCSRCSASGPCCGDPGSSMGVCEPDGGKKKSFIFSVIKTASGCMDWKVYAVAVAVLFLIILVVVCSTVPFIGTKEDSKDRFKVMKLTDGRPTEGHVWQCKNHLCQKVYQFVDNTFPSYSRCCLMCMGPQLWPYPIGYTFYSKNIVTLATNKLEYKFQSIPSEAVHQYLSEAFKLFIANLARLEKSGDKHRNDSTDLPTMKMYIQIDIESDPEPRLRLNTEEAYNLKIETVTNQVVIKLASSSFCGARHGLETLSQLILLDQSTGRLITLTHAVVKDAPSYRYRGLMIDTARNYIPLSDLMRTVDAMATVKLNTFHWRISDVTSFPLLLPKLPQLFEYGAYDRKMVYTKEDVKALVVRAGYRGIRVLIEVAAPGPVGRPWLWSPDVTCPTKNDNFTCDNVLCLRLNMKDSAFDTLQTIYTEILDMTKVDDIFHLSDGIFSLSKCFHLIKDREGFLDKALVTLKQANGGFMPKLPVVWYTPHLKDYEARTWERLGVQLNEVERDTHDNYLSKFKVIHSGKWDLSCEMDKQRCKKYRTWQDMYAWKSWRNVEVFTIEGGEALLWTDLVNSANLDFHLWPRAAAVAERLWSDMVVNVTAAGSVFIRLDSQRWRMLFHGINVQPVWPVWCNFNPGQCLEKLQSQRK